MNEPSRACEQFEFALNPSAQTLQSELFAQLAAVPAPGESPRYDERTDTLYMVGIDTPAFTRIPLDSVPGTLIESDVLPKRAGMCALTSDPETVVLAQEQDLVLYNLTNKEAAPLVEGVEPAELSIRLNDGDVLSFSNASHPLHGALLVGGISEKSPRAPECGLYAVLPDSLKVVKLLGGIINSNGLGAIGDQLIHTDTEARSIGLYTFTDFDSETPLVKTGEISFAALTEADSLEGDGYPKPDGLVVSQDESVICVACFRAGAVYGISPKGEHLFAVSVPAPQTASCEIVGSKLFITTGQSNPEKYPESGNVFVADLSSLSGLSKLSGKARGQFRIAR